MSEGRADQNGTSFAFRDQFKPERVFQSLNDHAERDRIKAAVCEGWAKRKFNTKTTVDVDNSPTSYLVGGQKDNSTSFNINLSELKLAKQNNLDSPETSNHILAPNKYNPQLEQYSSPLSALHFTPGRRVGKISILDVEQPIHTKDSPRAPGANKVLDRLDVIKQANRQNNKGREETLEEAPSMEEYDD